jgi:hypothetical protein
MSKNNQISNWSQRYYSGLKAYQHKANNEWFVMMFDKFLKADGVLTVPNLGKSFTKSGSTYKEVA